MTISVDGNVYLGKTELIGQILKKGGFVCLKEYDTQVDELEALSLYDRQQYYFDLEAERFQKGFTKDDSVLLDRSYLSMMAHSYAVDRLSGTSLFSHTLMILEKNLGIGKVQQMDRMVFLVQNGKYFHYYDVNNKGGEEILYDEIYRNYVDEFFLKLSEQLEYTAVKDCYRLVYEKETEAEEILNWIRLKADIMSRQVTETVLHIFRNFE